MATLHKVSEAKFKGTDLSSPTRKRTSGDFGTLTVSYNYEQNEDDASKEVFILLDDALFSDRFAMLSLEPDEALRLLHHLNELLGKPMGYAAYAAG